MQERNFKNFKLRTFKTAKMQSMVEGTKAPLEVIIVCTAYIKPTKKAQVYFDSDIKAFQKWLTKKYFSPAAFASIIRKYLPGGFYIDWLSGFSFAYDWSINSIRSYETGTTPFTMDIRVTVPDSIYSTIRGKISRLSTHIDPLYSAVDKTFNDIVSSSEEMVAIYYKR